VPIYEGHPNSRALGAGAIGALLALDPPPTAVLAMSDEIAIGVMEGARAAGLDVPAGSRSSASTTCRRRRRGG
jgi:DNA-binding LacI/PurR family transcriptional regulator